MPCAERAQTRHRCLLRESLRGQKGDVTIGLGRVLVSGQTARARRGFYPHARGRLAPRSSVRKPFKRRMQKDQAFVGLGSGQDEPQALCCDTGQVPDGRLIHLAGPHVACDSLEQTPDQPPSQRTLVQNRYRSVTGGGETGLRQKWD